MSRTWVSGTAITAFYNRNLGVIAVDSRCFNARRQRSADSYDKLIFVSLTIVLAGTGRRGVIEAVQVALPVMLGNRGFHTAQDAIDSVVSSINTILIDGYTDYSANENAFVMLCFVNDKFGITLIEINADGSEFVGVRRGGYPLCVNEGCGAEHMAQFQARCPLVREVDMDTMDERVVGWYAVRCILAAVVADPVYCGGDIRAFLMTRQGFSSYHEYYGFPNDPQHNIRHYPHY